MVTRGTRTGARTCGTGGSQGVIRAVVQSETAAICIRRIHRATRPRRVTSARRHCSHREYRWWLQIALRVICITSRVWMITAGRTPVAAVRHVTSQMVSPAVSRRRVGPQGLAMGDSGQGARLHPFTRQARPGQQDPPASSRGRAGVQGSLRVQSPTVLQVVRGNGTRRALRAPRA